MKQSFTGKSVLVFVGSAVLMSAALLFVHSCSKSKKKSENPTSQKPEKKVDKVVKKSETNNKRIIYLTFDDGPNKGTKNLIQIVHKRKIPVTAFIVGNHVYGSESQRKEFQMLKNDSLVELANHSYSHANNQYSKFYNDVDGVVDDFNRAKDSLILGNNYARTPGRNIWRSGTIVETDIKKSATAADELAKSGYKLIGWDLEWKQNGKMKLEGNHKVMMKKVDSIFYNDLEKTSRHLVLLTHDQYLTDQNSVNELELFIEGIQKTNRFEFRKISDYPHINDLKN